MLSTVLISMEIFNLTMEKFMKSILLSVMMVALNSISGSPAIAAGETCATSSCVPVEVSALLLSPQYASISSALSQKATNSGKTLKINGYNVFNIGQARYANVNLSEKTSASIGNSWIPFGDIVGVIQVGPMGEI